MVEKKKHQPAGTLQNEQHFLNEDSIAALNPSVKQSPIPNVNLLFSAKVENHTKLQITVTAYYRLYANPKEEEILIHTMQPGKSHTFAQKMNKEGYKFHIVKFSITDANKETRDFEGPFTDLNKDRLNFNVVKDERGTLHMINQTLL